MNWSQGVILSLCALNFVLVLIVVFRRPRAAPVLNGASTPILFPDHLAGGPAKAVDNSVILLTSDRDDRILDGEE